jgi:hypothetical protein
MHTHIKYILTHVHTYLYNIPLHTYINTYTHTKKERKKKVQNSTNTMQCRDGSLIKMEARKSVKNLKIL